MSGEISRKQKETRVDFHQRLLTSQVSSSSTATNGTAPQPGDAIAQRLQELALLTDTGRLDWSRPVQEALARAGLGTSYSLEEWAALPWYGPLEPYLKNERISDIIFNGPGVQMIVIEDGYRMPTGVIPHSTWLAWLQRQLLLRSGLVSLERPDDWPGLEVLGTADRRLRFAITRPPATPDGPSICVRVLPRQWRTIDALIAADVLSAEAAALLIEALRCGVTILIAGEMGSGKTTVTAALLQAIAEEKRVIVIEESTELPRLPDSIHHEVTRSGLSFSECVRFALRQAANLIVVGEVRGPEALAMLEAANTGHPGIATIHAPNCQSALKNLERMACMGGGEKVARGLMTSAAVSMIVVHIGRYGGRRRVGQIEEVLEMSSARVGDPFTTNVLFAFDPQVGRVRKCYPVERDWGRGRF